MRTRILFLIAIVSLALPALHAAKPAPAAPTPKPVQPK